MRGALGTAIKIAISAVILWALFRNVDLALFYKTAASVRPLSVVAVAFILIFTQSLSTLRWSIILKKDMDVGYLRLLSIYFIGMFFNNFLPTMVGGDLVKGYFLFKSSGRGDVSFASIFMDRYSGFTALMAVTSIALISGYPLIAGTGLPFFFALVIGGFVAGSLFLWISPLHNWVMRMLARIHFYGINKKIDTFYNVLMSYKGRKDILFKAFVCSLFVQCGVIAGYWFLGSELGLGVGAGYFFLFIPLTTAISMLPISLSGLGIREGAFVYLFTMVGASKEQALTLSLMWFAIMAIVSLIGGVEYLRMGGRRTDAEDLA
ncbi:MAG: flippase-like domain-containing protein [Deltaproteobacteria bacterium]|nr:flippase-like domain-containing protein [Deltaproteobacteria bacterium]